MITIIVLLILAGIAISAIAGEDGILTKATQAKNNWNSTVGKEDDSLDFLTQKINQYTEGIDWEYIYNDANDNPEKYIHPEQSETNGDIGIGTDGLPVNLDLWNYSIGDTPDYVRLGENMGYGGYFSAYSNDEIVGGKIQGKVPMFIKFAEMEEFLPVTELIGTFCGLTNLEEAPVLPITAIILDGTFQYCENLKRVPDIEGYAQEMYYTFSYCSNLETAPKVPDSVTSMRGCYYGCSILKNVPALPTSLTNMDSIFSQCKKLEKIPNIPQGVTILHLAFSRTSIKECPPLPEGANMLHGTFWGCSNLEVAPEIPENATNMDYTFVDCTNLKTVNKIPEKVRQMTWTFSGCNNLTGTIEINATPGTYADCFKNTSIANDANLVILKSSKSTNLDALLATKSSNSKITIESDLD